MKSADWRKTHRSGIFASYEELMRSMGSGGEPEGRLGRRLRVALVAALLLGALLAGALRLVAQESAAGQSPAPGAWAEVVPTEIVPLPEPGGRSARGGR